MLGLIMPMGGNAERMAGAPKPFQSVDGEAMWRRVYDNMPLPDYSVHIVRRNDDRQLGLDRQYLVLRAGPVPGGVVPAVRMGLEYAAPDDEILVAHADQLLQWAPDHFLSYCRRGNYPVIPVSSEYAGVTGGVFVDAHRGLVTDVMPKIGVDLFGLCGVYYFPTAKLAERILSATQPDDAANGELYIECALRRYIQHGGRVDYYPIRRVYLMDTREQLERAEEARPWAR